MYVYHKAQVLANDGIPVSQMRKKTGIFEELVKIKYTIGNDDIEEFKPLYERIDKEFGSLLESYKKNSEG